MDFVTPLIKDAFWQSPLLGRKRNAEMQETLAGRFGKALPQTQKERCRKQSAGRTRQKRKGACSRCSKKAAGKTRETKAACRPFRRKRRQLLGSVYTRFEL